MADVFISYKSDRRNGAQHLARILELNGYSVWFDYGLLSGRDFGPQIEREIRAAKAVIVLWCSLSRESRWVLEEADLAERLGTLTPVWLERVDPPLGFGRADTIDLTAWDGAPRSYTLDRLLMEVARRVGRDPTPSFRGLQEYEATWRAFGAPHLSQFALIAPVEEREHRHLAASARTHEAQGDRERKQRDENAQNEREQRRLDEQERQRRLAREREERERRESEARERASTGPSQSSSLEDKLGQEVKTFGPMRHAKAMAMSTSHTESAPTPSYADPAETFLGMSARTALRFVSVLLVVQSIVRAGTTIYARQTGGLLDAFYYGWLALAATTFVIAIGISRRTPSMLFWGLWLCALGSLHDAVITVLLIIDTPQPVFLWLGSWITCLTLSLISFLYLWRWRKEH
jgi:hypothetical protein